MRDKALHLGLVGWPLGHSLSPRLHKAALTALNLPGEYQLYPVPPFPEGQARLAELLGQLRKGSVHGLNVTIPHKQNVLPLLDELTPSAAAIGAANLLFLRAGRLTGDNADAAAFLADLHRNGLATTVSGSQNALVLGAGGSARAVVYALANAGWQVWIAARRVEQASAMAASLPVTGPAMPVLPLTPEALAGAYDLIVNTTPLGMFPDVESSPWPAELPFPPGARVYDLVYNPSETALVRQARASGLARGQRVGHAGRAGCGSLRDLDGSNRSPGSHVGCGSAAGGECMILPAQRMQLLTETFFAALGPKIEALQAAGKDVIRLDEGSPDLPPAPPIIATLANSAAAATTHSYQPHRGPRTLRLAWAKMYQRVYGVNLEADSEVIPLLGSKEGIFHFSSAFLNPGDVSLIPDPGYMTYTRGALFCGAEPYYMPLRLENHFLPDLQAIPASVLRRARLLWLNYPNNPTAAVASREFFAGAVAFARQHDLLLCHDAPYTQITYGEYHAASLLEIDGAKEVAVEFNSLSKSHNMAGWRVEALLGNAQALKTFFTFKNQYRQQSLFAHPGCRYAGDDRRPGLAGSTQRGLPPAPGHRRSGGQCAWSASHSAAGLNLCMVPRPGRLDLPGFREFHPGGSGGQPDPWDDLRRQRRRLRAYLADRSGGAVGRSHAAYG